MKRGIPLFSQMSVRENCYIAIFPRGKMARGKKHYITPVVKKSLIYESFNAIKPDIVVVNIDQF